MRWPFLKKTNNCANQRCNEESAGNPLPENEHNDEFACADMQEPAKRSGPSWEVIENVIAEHRHTDPFIGAKLGAKEVYHRLVDAMKDSKGVHIESLLCALGSLAGYACQAYIREEFINQRGMSEKEVFVIIGSADTRQYFYGDFINKPLAEDQYSIWSLAAGAAQGLGADCHLLDLNDIFKYVANSIGSDHFGIPRIPDNHRPADLPQNYLKDLWPVFFPIIKRFCPAPEWHILFGLAIQDTIKAGQNVIDPLLALSIVMECAIPMAKIDFDSL